MKVVALAGGVGGAKLVDGLARILPAQDLTVIVNTGDDFDHFGLRICPDLDTVCYTLAGIANPDSGWGRAEETWNAMESLAVLGGPLWFRLGDRDLGTHLERTRLLRAGLSLSEVTARFCDAWGIAHQVVPMSDQTVPTLVQTEEGELPFQEYFVLHRCRPRVNGFCFSGVEQAKPARGVLQSLQNTQLIIFCPSNPWVSIDPILAVPGIREELVRRPDHSRIVVAVSPIIKGSTIKGPAAKMFFELGIEPSARAVADHYGARQHGGLLDGFILDDQDKEISSQVEEMGVIPFSTNTFMKSSSARKLLAEKILAFGNKVLQSSQN